MGSDIHSARASPVCTGRSTRIRGPLTIPREMHDDAMPARGTSGLDVRRPDAAIPRWFSVTTAKASDARRISHFSQAEHEAAQHHETDHTARQPGRAALRACLTTVTFVQQWTSLLCLHQPSGESGSGRAARCHMCGTPCHFWLEGADFFVGLKREPYQVRLARTHSAGPGSELPPKSRGWGWESVSGYGDPV